jgi:hypothetical protein
MNNIVLLKKITTKYTRHILNDLKNYKNQEKLEEKAKKNILKHLSNQKESKNKESSDH